ncbi:Phosphodiesterase family protein [[Clostridium] ultunense Esp]|uniref:Phosphoesterase n=1 Tax=[Clostridium] ultunense Esp TaxID=1288971 RepID=M1YZE0_9FIRM|nr:metallophosphoesterase [Schnuerera ultunensis]CCQ95955.1 Phosphodiesterase family protein [[Clostridium] ultunense Esp]SHD76846.1 Phosphodiesterase family protein [[Clostridium] ultunense Esp]
MKIIAVSDTHGRIEEFVNKVNSMEKADLIIHLGDYVEDGLDIENKTGIKTVIVKGNGDFFYQEYKEDEILEIEGKRILLTHGHKYNVRYGIDNLLYKGEEVKADLILFGHTHVSTFIEESGIIVMNPGSPSMPRGFDRRKTFGIIDIKQKINIKIIELN